MNQRIPLLVLLFTSTLPAIIGFECFTCNMENSDTDECIDSVETCEPGIESCTMMTYISKFGRQSVRKFCTSPGTPIYQYLLFFPGSAMCQNIDTSNDHLHFSDSIKVENDVDVGPPGELIGPPAPRPPSSTENQTLHRAKRVKRANASPPAPPNTFSSSLLCVCSRERCNGGPPQEVLERLMFNQRPKESQKFDKKRPIDGFQTLRA
ncbi:hypothetical protein M3Y97_00024700 [Aphelenchoides bicaudatus]|nr:hypothetical protein M3Y97_00024700 [Aphelenchoides bicaudatus]